MAERLELRTLGLIRERSNYNRFKELLSEECFSEKLTKLIFRGVKQLHEKHKVSRIPIQDLIDFTQVFLEKPGDKREVRKILRVVKRVSSKGSDPDVSREIVTQFLQKRAAQSLVLRLLHGLEMGEEPIDWAKIKREVEEASGVSSTEHEYLDYFGSPLRERRKILRAPIATMLSEELDLLMGGGLGTGELGIILSPPGGGKTAALVNLGVGALRQGKKVVHITLEIKSRVLSRRYDMRISRLPFEKIRDGDERLSRRLKDLRKKGGVLVIKDLTHIRCRVGDLRSFLDSLKSGNLDFDMIIVDYADLLDSTKTYKEKRHELDEIYRDLRRLGNEFESRVWSASQAAKKSLERRVASLEHMAEDYRKAGHADFVLSFNQTPDEKEDGVGRIYLAKTREASRNIIVPCDVDFDRMLIRGRKRRGYREKDKSGSGSGLRPEVLRSRLHGKG